MPEIVTNLSKDSLAIISFILSFFSTYFAFRQYKNSIIEKKNQRILNNNFGSELFGNETIKRSTYCYIVPDCTDIDPSREAEPKNLCMVKSNIFSVLDDYLLRELPKDNAKHHILILADSGMGKTSFVLNYYAYNQKKLKRKRLRIALVPLGILNAEQYIDKIEKKEETVIFLDAFDEDVKAIKNHRERLSFLMKKCVLFKRVVITCRTQFFPSDEEIPKETGIVKVANRKAGESAVYTFNRLYLSPLSDDQVDIYLKNRFKWNLKKRKKGKALIEKIPNLKVRPMLLSTIPDLLNTNKNDVQYSYQLYEIMIDRWLERENGWIVEKDLRQFSEELAFNLYINIEKCGTEKIPKNELFFLANEWNINLENWQITGRSLLNRDADGNYKFSHRSIMEFLFVVHFFKSEIKNRPIIKWTDQQSNFALDFLKKNCGEISLEKANFINTAYLPEWIKNGLGEDGTYSQKKLINSIRNGFINLSGANLIKANINKSDLFEATFCQSNLSKANFSGADLRSADFSGANLRRVNFSEANLKGTDFSGANLKDVDFSEANIEKAIFNNTSNIPKWIEKGLNNECIYLKEQLIESIRNGFKELSGANLSCANLAGINLNKADLSGTCLNSVNLEKANCKNTKNLPKWIERGLDTKGIYSQKQLINSIRNGFKHLSGAYLKGADLKGIDLKGADIEKANLQDTINLPEWVTKGLDIEGIFSQKQLINNIRNDFKNLSGANLNSADLRNTNLKGANLSYANLNSALINFANLLGADIEKANFKNVSNLPEWIKKGLDKDGTFFQKQFINSIKNGFKDLRGANFNKADLRGADIERANFENTTNLPEWIKKGLGKNNIYSQNQLILSIRNGFKSLSKANLNEACLEKANLTEANLIKADLKKANLKESDLSRAKFIGANLVKANLFKANLTKSIFRGANLTGVNFNGADIEKANFKNTKNIPEWIKKGLDNDGTFSQEQLINSIRNGFKNLNGKNLNGVYFRRVDIERVNFKNISNLPEWIEEGLDNNGTYSQEKLINKIRNGFKNLKDSNLYGADLTNSNLKKVDFSGANLQDADLSGADLSGADLSDADLSGADLYDANFWGANTERTNFKLTSHIPERIEECLNNDGIYSETHRLENIIRRFSDDPGYVINLKSVIEWKDIQLQDFLKKAGYILPKADFLPPPNFLT